MKICRARFPNGNLTVHEWAGRARKKHSVENVFRIASEGYWATPD